MGYVLLIAGVALWSGAHLFKRLAPVRRAAMGDSAKGLVAALSLLAIVMMIFGYQWAPTVRLWYPPPFLTHVNNLLMVLAFYLFAASILQTGITRRIRHPQLTAVKTWALGHLLVKGTLEGLILFGGLLAWAVVAVIMINRAQRHWDRPAPAGWPREAAAVVIALIATYLVGQIHAWLGVWPFA
ncbi:MAG: NnrU family protein [Pararhodobacter sp.]|nr:NnrU family protein [Pararhodobacter sp.]